MTTTAKPEAASNCLTCRHFGIDEYGHPTCFHWTPRVAKWASDSRLSAVCWPDIHFCPEEADGCPGYLRDPYPRPVATVLADAKIRAKAWSDVHGLRATP